MKNRICLSAILTVISFTSVFAQVEFAQLENENLGKKEKVKAAFKSPRVIGGHSIEFLHPGTMDFRILHRFGSIDKGISDLFGLDQASMRMGFDFGILPNLMVGVGRSTYQKELDGFIKYAPWQQTTDGTIPLTVALVSGMTLNTMPWTDPSRKNFFSSRLAYYHQLLLGRKMNRQLTLQLSPTIVHTNLAASGIESNDVFALGIGGRYKVSNRVALMLDYFYNVNGIVKGINHNPLSVGVDIETGGHVFQLHFTNATGMNERAFINETTNSWDKAEIRYGFNLSRVFQIAKRK